MGKFKKRHNGITQTSEPHPFDSSRQNIGFANIKNATTKLQWHYIIFKNLVGLKSSFKLF
jgi:hypothetical protein